VSVRWLDDVLGANPWGMSLIIGDGTTFPRCPQHQIANIVGSLSGGCPYTTDEPAIDLTATSPLAFASQARVLGGG
jgi:hypothetical protein